MGGRGGEREGESSVPVRMLSFVWRAPKASAVFFAFLFFDASFSVTKFYYRAKDGGR